MDRLSRFPLAGIALACVLLLAGWVPFEAVAPAAQAPKPNVLLITLDTTRADRLGCYGFGAAKTPVLDALASGGARFDQAHAHVPLTLPSHATILTGELPSSLNLRVNGMQLGDRAPTLATLLKARGYWTGAFVSAVVLDRGRGLARGFDIYDDKMVTPPRSGGPPEERLADDTTAAALTAVSKATGPFFLWVHYYDPHYEYRPPEPFATQFAKAPYDGEIAYMDASVGKLLDGLKAQGKMANTLVVAVGDHGEGLGEHGEDQHGVFLYEYAMRVPLVLAWPGRVKAGTIVPDVVGLGDIAPTVLDLTGAPALKCDGRSLRSLLEGRPAVPTSLYMESYHGFFTYGWAPLRGILSPDWKYILAPKPELYAWKKGEGKNEYTAGSAPVAAALKALERYPAADEGQQAEMEKFLKDPSNQEALRQLMSLGYLSGGGARPDQAGLQDPKDMIGIEAELRQATELTSSGQPDKALPILLGILKRNSQNVPALSNLGLAYTTMGKYDQARVCFEELVKIKPLLDSGHLNLGTTYKRLRKGEAEKEYRAALAISPRMAEALSSLAELLMGQKRSDEAWAIVAPALASGVEMADLYLVMGILDASAGKLDAARFDFSRCIAMDPRRHEAMANLGRIAYQQGKADEAILQYERALRLQQRNPVYLATVGSLYLNAKNDPEKALRYFQQALAADPYGPEAANLKDMIRGLQSSGNER